MNTIAIPHILLVFDISALLVGKTQEWQEYIHIGNCYLPQVIYDEIKLISGRTIDPIEEKVAREFNRFWRNSGWIITKAKSTHSLLMPAAESHNSKQARLVVAVAQCAFGLSQEQPDNLVVFVTNNQPLLQRIQALNVKNLCAITSTNLLQWCRTGVRSLIITQKLHEMMKVSTEMPKPLNVDINHKYQEIQANKPLHPVKTKIKTSKQAPHPPSFLKRIPTENPQTQIPSPPNTQENQVKIRKKVYKKTSNRYFPLLISSDRQPGEPSFLALSLSSLLASVGVFIVMVIAWGIYQPVQFTYYWNHVGLPPIIE